MTPVKTCFRILCLSLYISPGALAGQRQIPLDELVRGSVAVVTGKAVAQERVEIRPGVFEITQHVRVVEVLKGQPVKSELATLGVAAPRDSGEQSGPQAVQTVRIRFFDGPNVPSGKVVYLLGDEGVWFLSEGGKDVPAGVYDASSRRDMETLDEVRRLLSGGVEDDTTLGGLRPLSGRADRGGGGELASGKARRDAEEGRNVATDEFVLATVEPKAVEPGVDVREALALADRFIAEQKIDVSKHQLASVVLVYQTRSAAFGQGLTTRVVKYWEVTYLPKDFVEAGRFYLMAGGQIYLHVNMSGAVRANYGE